MALLLAELHSRFITQTIRSFFHKEGISFRLQMDSLNNITLYDIFYHNRYLAQKVHIELNLFALLHARLLIQKLDIVSLHLQSLQEIAKKERKTSQSTFTIPFLIQKLSLSAVYPYKGTNRLLVKAANITLDQAQIHRLALRSPFGTLTAKGLYQNKRVRLKGKIAPAALPIKLQRGSLSLEASPQKLFAKLLFPQGRYQELNLSHIILNLHSDYTKVFASFSGDLAHPFAKAALEANATYEKELSFKAKAHTTITKELPIELKELDLIASGSPKEVSIQLFNPALRLHTTIYPKKRFFKLQSDPIRVAKLYPQAIKDLTLTIQASGTPKDISYRLNSNYFKLFGSYVDKKLTATLTFLRPYKKINLLALNPVKIAATPPKAHITTPLFQAKINDTNATLTFQSGSIKLQKKRLVSFKASITSLKRFAKEMSALYPIEVSQDIPLQADASFDPATKNFQAHITSPPTNFNFLDINLHGTPQKITIDYYGVVLRGRALYATKPSTIIKEKNGFAIDLWIEDQAKLTGYYDLSGKGDFRLTSPHFRYSGAEGDITAALDINITADTTIDVQGVIKLKGGVITYEPKRQRIVEDKDIIIIDKKLTPPKESFFQRFVALSIHITSKRPLLYKIPNFYALVRPDLMLYKEYQKALELLGTVTIIKGRYEIGDSYFDIAPSTLSFYGPPSEPLLELHLKTLKNGYMIYITLSGDAQNPILTFDSDPYLKPNEILSLLVFGSGSKSILSALGGSKFTSMLSNLFIKDLFAQMGIKLDTLSLITSGNRFGFEIGKRISDRITIVYKNDEISTLIIRYRLSDHLESEAIFGPDRSGIHIYYRNLK